MARAAKKDTAAKAADAQQTESQDSIKRRLYSEAMSELRSKHQSEFHDILSAKYEEAGLKYQRRLSAEEKERRTLTDLLEKYPDVATALATQGTVADAPDEPQG